jgi:hypothetical protein
MTDVSARSTASSGRRAASYWFVDGLPEIVLGLALFVSAALGLLWRMYVPSLRVSHGLVVGVGFLLYTFMGRSILDVLKSRITYPRTGYVQPPEDMEGPKGGTLTTLSLQPGPPPRGNVTSFGRRTVAVIFVFVFLVIPSAGSPRWFVPVLTAALAATLYTLNRTSEHPYRWWSALILGLMALVFLWVDVPSLRQPWLPLLLVGLWLLAQGGWTLINYLLENPYPRVSEGART